MQVADANWMLSSAVQSGAALIAIVGGLLGSRYVALNAEQGAARRRLREASDRLSAAQDREAKAGAEATRLVTKILLDDDERYLWIYEHDGSPTLDEVIQDVPEEYRSALEKHLLLIERELSEARRVLPELIPHTSEQETWPVFRAAHKLSFEHEGVWQWTYTFLSDARASSARRAAGGWSAVTDGLVSALRSQTGTIGTSTDSRRLGQARDQQEEANRYASRLQGEVAAAQAQLDATQQPKGFGVALGVLAYIAFVDIAIPLSLMVEGVTALSFHARLSVACLFGSGVLVLFVYLFAYSRFLKRSD
ncbi:hypothetical protein [Cellulomonas sp. SG140]|uniref:hypothetical protein n=1 Tax=Cellulomonas sp. SG140 TaxID=2976536 RepID=UPI0021E8456A|nr:hypothetical protein [Cellulomonas sp. SG140]